MAAHCWFSTRRNSKGRRRYRIYNFIRYLFIFCSFAKNLKGHLLLAHGTLDDNVPPYNTLLLVDALIRANKDFDLLLLPNRRHGFGNEPYMVRRRWDYFVRNLLGAEPPAGYELHSPAAPGRPGR
jgi:dipeptidyl-peptidase-4